MFQINFDYHENLTTEKVDQILDSLAMSVKREDQSEKTHLLIVFSLPLVRAV